VGNYVYDLPFGRGRHFLSSSSRAVDLVLGGWQTSGIVTLGSGLPYTVTFSSSVEGWPSNYADRVGNPKVDNPTRTQWFNPAAFTTPAPFTYGNAGRNSLFGPHIANWDTSAAKEFALTERYRLTFSADFFNAFNHTNFGNPKSNISVPSQVGQITSAGNPRDIQFSLHLVF
jgi:hypothetical protein